MDDSYVKVNSAKAWLLAARPKTLTAAAVPVMIGASAAFALFGCDFRVVPAVLCLLFALVMQIEANFVNDYFDFMKGSDDEHRLGPKRAMAQGWITAAAMRRALLLATAIACLVGLPLVCYGGWEMILVGLACVVFCFLYTITFSYIGLGDVLVLAFFGVVPVCLTFWLASPPMPLISIPLPVIVFSIACGLVVDTLLTVNNYRDIDGDRRTGKMTFIVRVGKRGGLWIYLLCGITATLVQTLFAWRFGWWAVSLPLLYIPFHVMAFAEMKRIGGGCELNIVLGMTARNILIYGVLVTAGFVLSKLLS